MNGARPTRASVVVTALVAVVVVGVACTSGDDPDEPSVEDPAPPPTEPEEPTDPPEAEPTDPDPVPDPGPDPRPPPLAAPEPMRAVWVHLFDDSLKSRGSIARLVDELVAADATAVIAQVARRHDAYYRSDVLPPTNDPGLEPGLDVIEELTTAAHAVDIEVHAWVSVAPTWHAVYDDLEAPAGWIPQRHGSSAPQQRRWVSRTVDGDWTDYLDPALPEVRDHVVAIVAELAATTRVDGIHLDYVRYEGNRSGYHPHALDRFRSETDTTGVPDPEDPVWTAWRQDQARAVIERAADAVAAAGREVVLSAAVITWGEGPTALGGFASTRAATEALQDWPGWVRDGLLDVVLPMNYFREHDTVQAGWLRDWLAFEGGLAADPRTRTRVVPGIGAWLNQGDAVLTQVAAALEVADGAAIYSYQQPAEDAAASSTSEGVRPFWLRLARHGWGGSAGG